MTKGIREERKRPGLILRRLVLIDEQTFRSVRDNNVAFGRLLALCFLIAFFFAVPQGAISDIAAILVTVLIGLVSIVLIVVKYRNPARSSPNIYVEIAYYLTIFVLAFSTLYWNYGTRDNFNIQFTHLDAIYFTIGTLATGTGNIVATSEVTRGLQALQMLLDLGLILIGVALVVTRLSSVKSQSK